MRSSPSLPSRRDFQRVRAEGRKAVADSLVCWVAPGPDPQAPARLGLSVSGMGAVARNRIKRRLRAAFLAASPPPGLEVAVAAGPSTVRAGFQELVRGFRAALHGEGAR